MGNAIYKVVPVTLDRANDFILSYHRHHKPVIRARFSIGIVNQINGHLDGVAMVGRPVARAFDPDTVAEVTRLCVKEETHNGCSILYAACARVCREMGYLTIQTYILDSEPGTSLIAAGWAYSHTTKGGDWNTPSRMGRRVDQPQTPKRMYFKRLGK